MFWIMSKQLNRKRKSEDDQKDQENTASVSNSTSRKNEKLTTTQSCDVQQKKKRAKLRQVVDDHRPTAHDADVYPSDNQCENTENSSESPMIAKCEVKNKPKKRSISNERDTSSNSSTESKAKKKKKKIKSKDSKLTIDGFIKREHEQHDEKNGVYEEMCPVVEHEKKQKDGSSGLQKKCEKDVIDDKKEPEKKMNDIKRKSCKKKQKKDKKKNEKKKKSFKMSLSLKLKSKSSKIKKSNGKEKKKYKKNTNEVKKYVKKEKMKHGVTADCEVLDDVGSEVLDGLGSGRDEKEHQKKSKKPKKKSYLKKKYLGEAGESPRKKKSEKSQKSLLQDSRIAKHACVLWSSENRRYYQQLDPSASQEEVEASMLKAWEALSNKEKLRYFNRAYGAVTDTNKHSTRKSKSSNVKGKKPSRPDAEAAMRSFCEMSEFDQKQKLWNRMLQLQRTMTRQSYRLFVTEFLRSFRTTVTSMRQKHDVKSSRWKSTMEGTFRRLLYGKILQETPVVDSNLEHRHYIYQKRVRSNFDRVVNRLISGKRVCFDPRVKSSSLDILLKDLEEASFYTDFNMESLVNELLEEVQDPFAANSVEDLISTAPFDCYRLIPISENTKPLWKDDFFEFNIAGENVPVPKPKNSKTDCDLLRNASLEGLNVFTGEEVAAFFQEDKDEYDTTSVEITPVEQMTENMYNSWYRMSHGLQPCCPLDAPSCILSDALVLNKIRKAEISHSFQRTLQNYSQSITNASLLPRQRVSKHVPLRPADVVTHVPQRSSGIRVNGFLRSSTCVTTSATGSRLAIPEIIPIRIPQEKQVPDPSTIPKVTKILIPNSSMLPASTAGYTATKKSTFHTVRSLTPVPGLSILNPVRPPVTVISDNKVQIPPTPHITVMVRKPAPTQDANSVLHDQNKPQI